MNQETPDIKYICVYCSFLLTLSGDCHSLTVPSKTHVDNPQQQVLRVAPVRGEQVMGAPIGQD